MNRVVFLLEEYSMKILLDGLLPRLFPGLSFLCLSHEGKHDLEKSIPRKLQAWREPGVCFAIIRDNDNDDCKRLKTTLHEQCDKGGRPDTLIRIACQELEAWYFGDADALADAFGKESIRNIRYKAKYRDPDSVQRPSAKLEKLIPEFQKVSGARLMAQRLTREHNRSVSFRVSMDGIESIAQSLSTGHPQVST